MEMKSSVTASNDVKRFEYMLKASVEAEVREYVGNLIKPKVDSIVKEVADEAVKNWTQHVRMELDAMSMATHIEINFVEHVVKTVMKESPITIVRKDDA